MSWERPARAGRGGRPRTEAEADRGVEQGGHQCEPGGDVAEGGGAGQEPGERHDCEHQPDALGETGRLGFLEMGRRREPGPHDRAEQGRDRGALHAPRNGGREQSRLGREQDDPQRTGGGQQHRHEHDACDRGSELLSAGVDLRGGHGAPSDVGG